MHRWWYPFIVLTILPLFYMCIYTFWNMTRGFLGLVYSVNFNPIAWRLFQFSRKTVYLRQKVLWRTYLLPLLFLLSFVLLRTKNEWRWQNTPHVPWGIKSLAWAQKVGIARGVDFRQTYAVTHFQGMVEIEDIGKKNSLVQRTKYEKRQHMWRILFLVVPSGLHVSFLHTITYKASGDKCFLHRDNELCMRASCR